MNSLAYSVSFHANFGLSRGYVGVEYRFVSSTCFVDVMQMTEHDIFIDATGPRRDCKRILDFRDLTGNQPSFARTHDVETLCWWARSTKMKSDQDVWS
jgi:hypothetical protein